MFHQGCYKILVIERFPINYRKTKPAQFSIKYYKYKKNFYNKTKRKKGPRVAIKVHEFMTTEMLAS